MNNAITVGTVLWVVGGSLLVFGVIAGIFLMLDLLNPFRSGH